MKLEDQVCSLELAKRLKELGVNTMSCFEWLKAPHIDYDAWEVVPLMPKQTHHLGYPAYSIAELCRILPAKIPVKVSSSNIKPFAYLEMIKGDDERWLAGYVIHQDSPPLIADINNNPANTLARIYIYLLENGLIENDIL